MLPQMSSYKELKLNTQVPDHDVGPNLVKCGWLFKCVEEKKF